MPTDAEIVAYVAEKVMGWTYPMSYHGELLANPITGQAWNPLADWRAAGELLERCRERQRGSVIGSNGCAHQVTCWIIDGIWAIAKQQNAVPEEGDRHLIGVATADSGPRAITLACYRATGSKEKP